MPLISTILLSIFLVIVSLPRTAFAVDTTPPNLISISVSKSKVVIGESLTITIEAEDPGSGISAIWMSLESPTKQQDPFSGQSVSFGPPTPDKSKTALIDYPGGIETGKWRVKISLMDNANNVQWNYPINVYVDVDLARTLQLRIGGTGSGSVNSNPSALVCTAGTCLTTQVNNTFLELIATPGGRSVFSGWSGDCVGTGECILTLSNDKDVTATFDLAPLVMVGNIKYSSFAEAFRAIPHIDAPTEMLLLEGILPLTNIIEKSVNLKGGYNPVFTRTHVGLSKLEGTLKIRSGKTTVDRIKLISPPNIAPVADPGLDQEVPLGSLVTLDGTNSSDANVDTLTYLWGVTSKPAGSTASLSGATTSKPTFTPDIAGAYVLNLVVNDGKVDSPVATVTVNVTSTNVAPVANAGPAQNTVVGDLVILDGSGSSDADGDSLNYRWQLVSQPTDSLPYISQNLNTLHPSFNFNTTGTYVFSLIVNDGILDSAVSTVMINVNGVAVTRVYPTIGPVGQWVYIDGSGFVDGQTTVSVGGGSSISAHVYSKNSLGFTVPNEATGTTSIVVATPNGAATSAEYFTVGVPTSIPTVTNIYPTLGPVGQWVYVYGSGFVNGQTSVEFGGVTGITANVYGPDQLGFSIPLGASGSTDVTVTTPNGTAPSTQFLTVGVPTASPTVSGINPNSGPAGQWVYVFGNNFIYGQTTVTIGGVANIETTVYGPDQLGFAVPANISGDNTIVIVTSNGSETSPQKYSVTSN